MDYCKLISNLALKISEGAQFCETIVPRLSVHISQTPTAPIPAFYQPSVCLIVQGGKSIFVDGKSHFYNQGKYLVSGFEVPVIGSVTQASFSNPYVCIQINFDRSILAEMLVGKAKISSPQSVIQIESASDEFLSAVYRLTALTQLPDDISALAPLREKEVLYWLLLSPCAMRLRQFAFANEKTTGLEAAIAFLRENFSQPFDVDAILHIAGMSHSVFYRAFKEATGTTPLQFRMRLRLQEVRRLILVENMSVSDAGFAVGYNNPSQLSREYRDLYGKPPSVDDKETRELQKSAKI